MRFNTSRRLEAKANQLIPGGCHSDAKANHQYPELAPGFIARGLGSHVWDVDGNRFIEYGCGNRSVGLGHAYPAVIDAVRDQLIKGVNFTRPAEIELRAAQSLLSLIPGAEMVKFCKNGSDATTAAVKLARAATRRDLIACCQDHPFFSSDDWYIGTTSLDAGIPPAVKALTLGFRYNDLDSVRRLFAEHPAAIAGLILEPAKYEEPRDGFLSRVRELCDQHGALLILDEMITGFRWDLGGGQSAYRVEPDLSCWGKAMANGFSVSALVGKRRYMQLGDGRAGPDRLFLLSSTHGAETHALAAAIATIEVYKQQPVIETIYRRGERLRAEATQIIAAHGLQDYIKILGRPCCLSYTTCDRDGRRSLAMRSLLLQETIRRGILMTSLVVGYTHSDQDIDRTLVALDGALGVYTRALDEGPQRHLVGRPVQGSMYRTEPSAEPRCSPSTGVFDADDRPRRR